MEGQNSENCIAFKRLGWQKGIRRERDKKAYQHCEVEKNKTETLLLSK